LPWTGLPNLQAYCCLEKGSPPSSKRYANANWEKKTGAHLDLRKPGEKRTSWWRPRFEKKSAGRRKFRANLGRGGRKTMGCEKKEKCC